MAATSCRVNSCAASASWKLQSAPLPDSLATPRCSGLYHTATKVWSSLCPTLVLYRLIISGMHGMITAAYGSGYPAQEGLCTYSTVRSPASSGEDKQARLSVGGNTCNMHVTLLTPAERASMRLSALAAGLFDHPMHLALPAPLKLQFPAQARRPQLAQKGGREDDPGDA